MTNYVGGKVTLILLSEQFYRYCIWKSANCSHQLVSVGSWTSSRDSVSLVYLCNVSLYISFTPLPPYSLWNNLSATLGCTDNIWFPSRNTLNSLQRRCCQCVFVCVLAREVCKGKMHGKQITKGFLLLHAAHSFILKFWFFATGTLLSLRWHNELREFK